MSYNVVAIIVAYNSSSEPLRRLLRAAQPQVTRILVVDNSDDDAIRSRVLEWGLSGVEYHFVGENVGIGAAQNIGIQRAAEMGASHVLLLDHDSLPEPDMVSRLAVAAERLTGSGVKLAAVGPRYRLHGAEESSRFVQLGAIKFRKVRCTAAGQGEAIPADILLASGCLIEMNSMSDIGYLDDSLFIDQVDTEWCMRAKAKGYQSYGVCDAIMNHALGDSVLRIWLGRTRTMPVHSPLRMYYIFRNSVLLYKRPYMWGRWMLNNTVWLLPMLVLLPILVPPRLGYIRMILKGLVDGLFGRAGRYPP